MWPMTTVTSERSSSISRKKISSDSPVMIGGIRNGMKITSCSSSRSRPRLLVVVEGEQRAEHERSEDRGEADDQRVAAAPR